MLGAPVSEELVTAVAVQLALPHHEIHDALDGLRAARMLDGDQFVHAVVQNTAYVRTTRARRRTLHLAAADACSDLVPDDERPGFLARHLYLAGAGPRAVEALENAATEALKFGRHEEAVLHLVREAELRRTATDEQRHERADRLVVLGALLERLARYLESERALIEAIDCGARGAEHLLVAVLRRLGRHSEAVALAESALAQRLEPESRTYLVEELAWSLVTQARHEEAFSAVESDAALARSVRGDMLRAYIWGEQGRNDDALALLESVGSVFERAGDDASLARAHRYRAEILGCTGALDEADCVLQLGIEAARRCGAASEALMCLNFLVAVSDWRGDLAAAVQHAREAVIVSDRLRHANGRLGSRNNLAFALHRSGRNDEALPYADEALRLARHHAAPLREGDCLHTRGTILLALGRVAEALADAEAACVLLEATENEGEARALLESALKAEKVAE